MLPHRRCAAGMGSWQGSSDYGLASLLRLTKVSQFRRRTSCEAVARVHDSLFAEMGVAKQMRDDEDHSLFSDFVSVFFCVRHDTDRCTAWYDCKYVQM
jgi:hypothetical protein